MFNNFKLNFFKESITKTLKRFPLQIIYLISINWLILYLVNFYSQWIEEWRIISLILTLILSFFLSIWIKFFNETIKNKAVKITNYVLLVLFWILFYKYNTILDFNNYEIISYILSAICIFCFLFFAPFIKQILKNDLNQNIFYAFVYKIWVVILSWIVIGWILLLLWMLTISTIEYLFSINDIVRNLNLYENWLTLSLVFFPALYCLWKLPLKEDFLQEHLNENKFISFLIKYISIPFIYIYFIILYSYSIKVILNFADWPKWEVSWLVIMFSIFWYIIYLFSYIHQENNKFIKTFRTFFPYVVLPQILMLFYSIYLRINQYDLTINRYLTVVFWITLAIISLYYIFSKRKSLHCIMIIVSLISVIISIWPWWIFSLPESRQENSLKEILLENSIINEKSEVNYENWKKLDSNVKNEIYSKIEYLCGLNNCRSVAKIFPNEYEEIKIEHYNSLSNEERISNPLPSKWKIIEWITSKLNIEYSNNSKESWIITVSLPFWEVFPINVMWYSKILELENDKKTNWEYWYINNNKLIIRFDKEEKVFDLSDINKKIELLVTDKDKYSNEDLTFILDENTKIIFTYYSFKINGNNQKENYYSYNTWYILIK